MEPLQRLDEPVPVRLDRFPDAPTTRFAPSVTGRLHLGHVVNAVFTWGLARALGGTVILRLEDHDRGRWRAEHETAILDDLEWLGLEPDLGTIASFRAGPSAYRQGDRGAAYRQALEHLRRVSYVFACDCTRKQVAERSPREHDELWYSGRCRDRGLEEGPDRGVRVVLEPSTERFDDAFLGAQEQSPWRQCGDLLVRDRHGSWTYHLAVTVDDAEQGVDLVVRGRDLLDSTGRQLQLARLLGRETPPTFAHHPLIGDASGRKLSKSEGASGIAELRESGVTPDEALGRAAWLAGLTDEPRPLPADELAGLFDRRR